IKSDNRNDPGRLSRPCPERFYNPRFPNPATPTAITTTTYPTAHQTLAIVGTEAAEKGGTPIWAMMVGCMVWAASCHRDALGMMRLAMVPMFRAASLPV